MASPSKRGLTNQLSVENMGDSKQNKDEKLINGIMGAGPQSFPARVDANPGQENKLLSFS